MANENVETTEVVADSTTTTTTTATTETQKSDKEVEVSNVKDDLLTDRIIKQVEYYFGDINLSKDKFMQEELQKDSGWILLETLIKFNRLKSLTTDFQVIIDSIKKSTSNLLEIDEENKKVRRAKPLPDNLSEFETSLKQNTVYAKGFPSTISLDELYQFFEKYGKVLQIFMRRFPATKQFKGSVFVTFETSEQMKKFLDEAEVKYNDQVLNRESQEDYFKRKAPVLDSIKESKKKRDQEKLEKKKQQEEAEEAYFKGEKRIGAVIHLKGIGSDGSREKLKELFDNYAKVKWVDFSKGDKEGYVRFGEDNKAKSALESALGANNGEIKIGDAKLEVRVLEGEEEEAYWKVAIKKLIELKRNKNNKRKRPNNKSKRNNKPYNKNGKKRGLEDQEDKEDAADEDDDDDGGEDNDDDENGGENADAAADNDDNDESVKTNGNKKLKV